MMYLTFFNEDEKKGKKDPTKRAAPKTPKRSVTPKKSVSDSRKRAREYKDELAAKMAPKKKVSKKVVKKTPAKKVVKKSPAKKVVKKSPAKKVVKKRAVASKKVAKK